MTPEDFDEIAAAIRSALAQNPSDPDAGIALVRLITASHEAGHAVLAELNGVHIINVVIDDDGTGCTQPSSDTASDEGMSWMIVAGFAAVGEMLGHEAEQRNRTNVCDDDESDLWRALSYATALVGTDPTAVSDLLTGRERDVRASLATPAIGNAVKEVAANLYEYGNIGGDQLRHVIGKH